MRFWSAVVSVCVITQVGCSDDAPCDCADAASAIAGDAGVPGMDAAEPDAAAADGSLGDADAAGFVRGPSVAARVH